MTVPSLQSCGEHGMNWYVEVLAKVPRVQSMPRGDDSYRCLEVEHVISHSTVRHV